VLLLLVQRASGLFVWASTVSGYVNGHDPRTRLDLILQGGIASGAEVALDSLYIAALESSGLWADDDFVRAFRDILGVVLIARQPLSGVGIDALLQRPEHIPSVHTTSLLACVLQQSPTARVLHPSFADFLTTKNRCHREVWFFDQPTYHRNLAIHCLRRMDAVLEHNMSNITFSVDLGRVCPKIFHTRVYSGLTIYVQSRKTSLQSCISCGIFYFRTFYTGLRP
jgi:hypothetical protein